MARWLETEHPEDWEQNQAKEWEHNQASNSAPETGRRWLKGKGSGVGGGRFTVLRRVMLLYAALLAVFVVAAALARVPSTPIAVDPGAATGTPSSLVMAETPSAGAIVPPVASNTPSTTAEAAPTPAPTVAGPGVSPSAIATSSPVGPTPTGGAVGPTSTGTAVRSGQPAGTSVAASRVPAPTVTLQRAHFVTGGGSLSLSASAVDPSGGRIAYYWDLDADGEFDAFGPSPVYSAAGRDGPSTHSITLMVCNAGAACSQAEGLLSIANALPEVGVIVVPAGPTIVNTQLKLSAGFSDAGATDTHSVVWDWGDGTATAGTIKARSGVGTASGSHVYKAAGTYTVRVTVTDNDGDSGQAGVAVLIADPAGNVPPTATNTPVPTVTGTATPVPSATATVTPLPTATPVPATATPTPKPSATPTATAKPNRTPVADPGQGYTVAEGGSVRLNGSGSDPDGDSLTFTWDLDHNGTFETSGQNPSFSAAGRDGPAKQVVVLRVCDNKNACADAETTIAIENVAPTVQSASVSTGRLSVGAVLNVTAAFTDPGVPDTHTAVVAWGDGSAWEGPVHESGGVGTVSASHTYTAPGKYAVTVRVTDKDGASGEALAGQVEVSAPSLGSVTGGGRVTSKVGAYVLDPKVAGEAQFGFNCKTETAGAAPKGQLEFSLKGSDLTLHSTGFEKLDINGNTAVFSGTGSGNGRDYKFRVTAVDGQPDKFRIEVWDLAGHPLYDSALYGADGTVHGGEITVHRD